jgi:hypothetical protein
MRSPGLKIEILRQAQDRLWGTQAIAVVRRCLFAVAADP